MKLSVFGAGYVGLVSAAGFSDFGHTVCCGDVNQSIIETLKSGDIPFTEPNLHELVSRQVGSGRLSFTTDLNELVKFADVLIFAVGTPGGENGDPDLSFINELAMSVGQLMESDKTVVVKSTVPPGTAKTLELIISSELAKRGLSFRVTVVSNPEFLREGSAVVDFLQPDRIIVGIADQLDVSTMKSLYAPLIRDQHRMLVMSRESAELTKYAANAMLATRISFMNEIAQLAERVGADINSVELGVGSDRRVGSEYLSAGIGFGGSCFPKDLKALSIMGAANSLQMHLVDATLTINSQQRHVLIEKDISHFSSLKGLKCAVWGLSFKPETDDTRNSPSLEIIELLLDEGAVVVAYDPAVRKVVAPISVASDNFRVVESSYEAVDGADMLFLLTEWREFMSPDFRRVFDKMRQPVVFDGRNIWKPESLKSRGFTYFSIGR